MTPITFPRRDPNGCDPTIIGERIVMWEDIERGARIYLDNGKEVLVGENSQAVLFRIDRAFKEASNDR